MVMFTQDENDRDYFYERAEAELILAQAATHPAAVTSHFALAENYLDLVYGNGTDAPSPNPDRPDGEIDADAADEATDAAILA